MNIEEWESKYIIKYLNIENLNTNKPHTIVR